MTALRILLFWCHMVELKSPPHPGTLMKRIRRKWFHEICSFILLTAFSPASVFCDSMQNQYTAASPFCSDIAMITEISREREKILKIWMSLSQASVPDSVPWPVVKVGLAGVEAATLALHVGTQGWFLSHLPLITLLGTMSHLLPPFTGW